MYGAWLTYVGVVLLSHAGCPYICGYIWSGYTGTTIVRGVNFASPQVDRVGQIISESKFPPFIGCCRFLVLQIRVVSCPCSPISMQLEPIDYKNNVDSSTLLNI